MPGTRGRRRLYGERIDADAIAGLPISTCRIEGYGGRVARLRDVVCRPRFLRGAIVRAVWCDLETRGGWARRRLLLSTDPALSAPAIVEAYSNRWSAEPLFRDLKMVDGLGAMWQRGRVTLLRWLHLVQIARTLLVLLTARAEPHALIRLGGWSDDPDPGQGGARGTLPGFRGFPPHTRNLSKIGTHPPYRSSGNRRGCLNAAQLQLLQDLNDR